MSEERNTPSGETTILSEADKRNFDGITIEEDPSDEKRRSPYFKVYTFGGSNMSLVTKLLIGLAIVAFIGVAIFFGGLFLIGLAIFAVIGALLTLLKGLF